MSKETTRVTQVHGSMHGKEILKLVKEIKEKKDLQKRTTDEKIKKKEEEKLLFLQCKSRCVCGEKVFGARAKRMPFLSFYTPFNL